MFRNSAAGGALCLVWYKPKLERAFKLCVICSVLCFSSSDTSLMAACT